VARPTEGLAPAIGSFVVALPAKVQVSTRARGPKWLRVMRETHPAAWISSILVPDCIRSRAAVPSSRSPRFMGQEKMINKLSPIVLLSCSEWRARSRDTRFVQASLAIQGARLVAREGSHL
jgi:hypothetical protein